MESYGVDIISSSYDNQATIIIRQRIVCQVNR